MAYLGNTPTSQSFTSNIDYFSGTGSATAFTLSRSVATINDILVVVDNVVQRPTDAYTLSGSVITFTSAPLSGTNNIYVRYMATTTQVVAPAQNSVSYSSLTTDMQSNIYGFKNRIINGAMRIDQRNAGASITGNNQTFGPDRWVNGTTQSSKFTVQQLSATPPSGFSNYLGVTSSSAYTPVTNDELEIVQKIEGYNIADLAWGTAAAQTVTLSFWVRSSLTGTFGGVLTNADNTRIYPYSYIISSQNTWEYKTVTITGDTTGTWLTTNGIGIQLFFSIGVSSNLAGTAGVWGTYGYKGITGQVNVVATSGATWYVTGVQLEKGSTATNFDYRPYGTELALCQRYYSRWDSSTNGAAYASNVGGYTTSAAMGIFSLPVTMRANPTLTTTGTASNYKLVLNGTPITCTSVPTIDQSNPYSLNIFWYATVTVGSVGIAGAASTTAAFLGFNAEL